ncbi:MAG: hypothetical protein KGM17_13020 [Sphingomonadales bacterium]|nr:hypothetical protein [Sphingomonadales bacterium]
MLWPLLLIGLSVIALLVLVAFEFGSRARQLRALRAEREDERAAYAEWHARHGQRLIDPTACDLDEGRPD